ncbi:hypothetical protein PUR61_01940 [Streptomyces sp. BE20]|uniref:hypothetical protein n=1 Tax=Streptomyces sp. BE20 TaxID=3002525 RepID=UPI002E7A7EC0|nr:hypothetical protein [Streptomyces sp. BE20]MEE1820967.1 hypothetical protein [Streptomyces sp. BE20]
MSHTLAAGPALIGRATSGKRVLPAGASRSEFVAQLRRALHTIECREVGPEGAERRFGRLADRGEGRQVLFIDADRLLAEHPDDELLDLVRAVRQRGPATDVVLVPPM